MKKKITPFSTSLMGSMPRSAELINAHVNLVNGELTEAAYNQLLEKETKEVVRLQEQSGIDIIVNGELSRDNYMSFVAGKVDGIELMSLDEITNLMNDKANFEKSLESMDAADNSMNNPVVTDRISVDTPLVYDEMKVLKSLTKHPIKATLPSPYLLTRSMWLEGITSEVYEDRKELGKDVVTLIINEVKRLISLGVDIIQIDEPILSDVVFNQPTTKDSSNSFY